MHSVWVKQVNKGRISYKVVCRSRICSNHVVNGKPTYDYPYPTLFLVQSSSADKKDDLSKSPKKRRKINKVVTEEASTSLMTTENTASTVLSSTSASSTEKAIPGILLTRYVVDIRVIHPSKNCVKRDQPTGGSPLKIGDDFERLFLSNEVDY
eukprot:gene96-702_t